MIRDTLNFNANRKFKMRIQGGGRRRNAENVEIELKLCQWLLEFSTQNSNSATKLTKSLILKKARALFQKDVNLSRNWFLAFAQRYDLQHDHVTDTYRFPNVNSP